MAAAQLTPGNGGATGQAGGMDLMSLLGLLIPGLGTASAIIGNQEQTLGNPDDVVNINQAQTDQMIQQLTQLLGQAQGQTDAYAGQAGQQYGALSQQGLQSYNQANQQLLQGLGTLGNATNAIGGIQGQIANMQGYDPTKATSLFQDQIPMFQELAQDARSQALSQFETPATTQALLQADQNVGAVANQFAGLGGATSGAAAAAAAQGAQAPLAQLAVDRANLANQAYQGTLNPMLQQGYGAAQNQAQFQYGAGVEQLMNLLSAASQQGQLGAAQAGAANQAQATGAGLQQAGAGGLAGLSSLYAGLQGGALSGLTQLSAPEYWQPTYVAGSGLLGM